MKYPPRPTLPAAARRAAVNTLTRKTPTGIAEASYQAARARRFPLVNGIPDPRATWRSTVDGGLLVSLLRQMLDEELALIDRRQPEVASILLADIDARFPPADMAVLARYGLTHRSDVALIRDGSSRGFARIPLPEARMMPSPAKTSLSASFYSVPPVDATEHEPLVPEAARSFFEERAAARARAAKEQALATPFASHFEHEHKRVPTWRDAGAAFPRLAAWMAAKRGAA